ncbi:MAG: acyl-CoA dehydrogenase family protein, partial [Gammaproteobacteria bacterium]|nr:acyl-CoA dehydrogenase family protein [Gammaproteobacteria bacterium]
NCGDHHVLTGRWGFSSGCRHATWMIGVAPLNDKSGWVSAFFPVDVPIFHDTWQVQGLRGTGSFEFSVEDLKVEGRWIANLAKPANHDWRFFKIPTGLVFAVSFASVALGVARAGLDATLDIAQGKVPRFRSSSLKNDGDVQKMMGEAEIRWRAARAFLHDTVDKLWQALASQDGINKEQRVALRMAGTHVIREAAAVLDLGYTVIGSTSIYQSNPLQRRFQDMHVITQHVQARLSHYGYVGRHFLGHDYEPGPLN